MLNRLLENWLDSASERSYQSAFCQLLAAQGHTVLHSTRHNVLEYGKDILTTDPQGTPCAYQLKGNPGSRLTLDQFRKIQDQLVQLVTQPPIFPGLKIQPYNTYLVTNGIIEEEVQRAVDDLNRGFEASNAIGRPLGVIQRGHLLKWANELGTSLWPSGLQDANRLLQLLVTDGKQQFPTNLLHELLNSSLLFTTNKPTKVSAGKLKRHITSAALLTAVCLKNFSLENNYYAVIVAWSMFSAYVVGACEKYDKSFKRNGMAAVEIARDTIFYNLKSLCDELTDRKHYVEGNALVDVFTYRGRFTLLVALMSLYWFWCEDEGWPSEEHRLFLQNFLPKGQAGLYMWGEGAIPQLLIHLWYLRSVDASITPDILLGALLRQIVQTCNNKNSIGIPTPYYTFEDTTRRLLRGVLSLKEDPFHGDTFRYSSFVALPLMHLLVRTNLKQNCKSIWPDFSKLGFRHFEPRSSWMYCLKEADEGTEITEQPKLTKDWEELTQEARDVTGFGVPTELKNDKYLLMLFVIVFPHRGTPSAIRWLGRAFNETWFIGAPIE